MKSPVGITAYGQAQTEEALDRDSRITLLQRVLDLAVERALRGVAQLPADPSRTGIVYLTELGESYPVRWAEAIYSLHPLPAREFGNIVHNNVAGYVASKRDIRGPQLVLTHGDVLTLAETMLLAKDCDLMLCCVVDLLPGARVLALEIGGTALTLSAPSLDRFDRAWSELTNG